MRREVFERALHIWLDWGESIIKSRQSLGYDPKWPREKCIDWIEGQHGQERHYPQVREQALAELKRLELPPTLREYWEDCFYSDYREDNRVMFDKITRCLSERKSLPALPCDWGVVWHEDEDTRDPWLRVEIRLDARFATKELFQYAARYAYQTVESHLWIEGIKRHPVLSYVNQAKVEFPAFAKSAIDLWRSTRNIDQTLRKLYFSPEMQADLQMELSARRTRYERQVTERDFRKRFRDRVMAVFKRAKMAVPRPKSKWWLAEN